VLVPLLPDPQAAASVTRLAESTTAPARLVKIRGLVIGLLPGRPWVRDHDRLRSCSVNLE
jgi:hypothetical protein